jgi:hypothetical protein
LNNPVANEKPIGYGNNVIAGVLEQKLGCLFRRPKSSEGFIMAKKKKKAKTPK